MATVQQSCGNSRICLVSCNPGFLRERPACLVLFRQKSPTIYSDNCQRHEAVVPKLIRRAPTMLGHTIATIERCAIWRTMRLFWFVRGKSTKQSRTFSYFCQAMLTAMILSSIMCLSWDMASKTVCHFLSDIIPFSSYCFLRRYTLCLFFMCYISPNQSDTRRRCNPALFWDFHVSI